MMRAPVRHRAAGIFVEIAKGHMRLLLHILRRRRRTLPHIPVETGGHGSFLERPLAATMRQPDIDVLELAQAAVADQLTGKAEILVTTLLAAGLENAFGFAHGFHQSFPFVDRQRERFLTVNILARLERGEIDQRVPMVGRAIDDEMNVIALEQLAEILVRLRVGPGLGRLREIGLVHVAHRQHLTQRRRLARDAAPTSTAANERDAGPVIRAERLGRRVDGLIEKPLRQCRRGGDGSGGF